MKKFYFIAFFAAVFVFVGYFLLYREQPLREQPLIKQPPQDMVFRMGTGWTGGMTGYPVFEDGTDKVKQLYGRSVFVNDNDAEEILKQGGGLPNCTVGNPKIMVSANVTLAPAKGVTATLEPVMERYYEVKINKLYNVDIDAKECED